MVAAELARLQERERYLDYEMRALRQQRANLPTELDDEAIAKLLGEETARIVHVARESSNAIRIKAEEAAERAIQEATEAAQQLRDAAEAEAAQRLSDAHADAEAEIAMAKQQGREMVEEARAYRERALGELAKRRDLARQQIDQLLHGRDRLVQAFERARLVAVDVVAELTPLGELDEYVNLSPTTGPVPMMVPKSRLGDVSSIGDDALALRVAAAAAAEADAGAAGASDEAIAPTPDSSIDVTDDGRPVRRPSQRRGTVGHTAAVGEGARLPGRFPAGEDRADRRRGRRCRASRAGGSAPADEHDDGDDPDDVDRPDGAAPAEGGVDDLFARLRAGREVVDGMDVDASGIDERDRFGRAEPVRAARRGAHAVDRRQRPQAQAGARRRAERGARPVAAARAGALGRRPAERRRPPERHLLRCDLGRGARRRRGRRRLDGRRDARRQLVARRWPRRAGTGGGIAP